MKVLVNVHDGEGVDVWVAVGRVPVGVGVGDVVGPQGRVMTAPWTGGPENMTGKP